MLSDIFSNHTEMIILMTSMIHLQTIVNNITPFIQLILHLFFKYNMYCVIDKQNKLKIIKNMKNNFYCFTYDENKDPLKYLVEKSFFPQYFAYHDGIHSDNMTLFCNESQYNHLMMDESTKSKRTLQIENLNETETNQFENNHIIYFTYSGSIGYNCISEMQINLPNIEQWYPYQESLYENIMQFYNEHNYCKIFLSGEPGKGKTYFSYLLAQRLNCYMTDQYNPTDPGEYLNNLYYRAKKISLKKPLIIMLDEVDVTIDKIQNKEIIPHKNFKSEVHDKISWNQFMDRISFGLYPYIIIVMISNKKKTQLDKTDPSYLRSGRVDICVEW
jgi:hypothetical protein